MPQATVSQRRARLGSYGFGATLADSPTRTLSGGEKARLLFALAAFHAPHILVLDEPTNHLDVDSREALIHAINDYEGAVILISHERHLIETCADRLWLVSDGTVKPFDGDMDDYTRLVLERSGGRAPRRSNNSEPAAKPPKANPVARSRQVQDLEANIATLQDKLAVLDRALADPELYVDEPRKAADFAKLRAKLAADLDRAESRWLRSTGEPFRCLRDGSTSLPRPDRAPGRLHEHGDLPHRLRLRRLGRDEQDGEVEARARCGGPHLGADRFRLHASRPRRGGRGGGTAHDLRIWRVVPLPDRRNHLCEYAGRAPCLRCAARPPRQSRLELSRPILGYGRARVLPFADSRQSDDIAGRRRSRAGARARLAALRCACPASASSSRPMPAVPFRPSATSPP